MGWRVKGLIAGAAALLLSGSAFSGQEGPAPQYGGDLEIGTVYYTISALSFDNYDFAWKHNHDTGAVYEQLFATDLSQSQHNGGKFAFVASEQTADVTVYLIDATTGALGPVAGSPFAAGHDAASVVIAK